jgi:hypothetical protein
MPIIDRQVSGIPLYKKDCPECYYLGSWELTQATFGNTDHGETKIYDLYICCCVDRKERVLVARYGSNHCHELVEKGKYVVRDLEPDHYPLKKALALAVQVGLFDIPPVPKDTFEVAVNQLLDRIKQTIQSPKSTE